MPERITLNRNWDSPGCPGSDAGDPVDLDANDDSVVSATAVRERRTDVDLCQIIHQREPGGRPSLIDRGSAGDQQMFEEESVSEVGSEDRQDDVRITSKIADLRVPLLRGNQDLVAVQTHPDDRYLGRTVDPLSDDMSRCGGAEKYPGAVSDHAHVATVTPSLT
jgi:hypothetical protein